MEKRKVQKSWIRLDWGWITGTPACALNWIAAGVGVHGVGLRLGDGAWGAGMRQNRRHQRDEIGLGEAAASGKIELSRGAARRLRGAKTGAARRQITTARGARKQGMAGGARECRGRGLQKGENGRAEGAGRARRGDGSRRRRGGGKGLQRVTHGARQGRTSGCMSGGHCASSGGAGRGEARKLQKNKC